MVATSVMNPPLRERLGPELQQRADGGFAVCRDDTLLQSLRRQLHERRGFALLMEPPAECVQRTDPRIGRRQDERHVRAGEQRTAEGRPW